MRFEPSDRRKAICKNCGKANYKHRRSGERDGECPKDDNDYDYRRAVAR